MLKILDWLELHPGATWQQRWDSSGAGAGGPGDWRDQVVAGLRAAGRAAPGHGPAPQARGGHGPADRRRRHPPGPCLAADHAGPGQDRRRDGPAPGPRRDRGPAGAAHAGHRRERHVRPGGRADRGDHGRQGRRSSPTSPPATASSCWTAPGRPRDGTSSRRTSPFFYQLLHAAGAFPPAAPATVRMIGAQFAGQLTAEQLIDRYGIACQPVRDLLADYLRERQPGIDYNSLSSWPRPWSRASGRTSKPTTPASAPCTCRPPSPPRGRSACGPGPSALPAAASRPSPASPPTTT